MEETKFSTMANNYFKKWRTAEEIIRRQREEIEELGKECTRLRRENYRLIDRIHILKMKGRNVRKRHSSETKTEVAG